MVDESADVDDGRLRMFSQDVQSSLCPFRQAIPQRGGEVSGGGDVLCGAGQVPQGDHIRLLTSESSSLFVLNRGVPRDGGEGEEPL